MKIGSDSAKSTPRSLTWDAPAPLHDVCDVTLQPCFPFSNVSDNVSVSSEESPHTPSHEHHGAELGEPAPAAEMSVDGAVGHLASVVMPDIAELNEADEAAALLAATVMSAVVERCEAEEAAARLTAAAFSAVYAIAEADEASARLTKDVFEAVVMRNRSHRRVNLWKLLAAASVSDFSSVDLHAPIPSPGHPS